MFRLCLNLLIFFIFSVEIFADYFKWEILFAENGYGSEVYTIPVVNEGQVNFFEKDFKCRTESFWTRIEADLLLEGKTLVCNNGEKKRKIRLVCRDNHRNRKYNALKELYPVSKFGFLLYPKLGSRSPYMELRCFF